MTDAKNEWVARVPSECLYCEDCGTETLASAYAAERLAMECNEQLTAARARIAELEKRLTWQPIETAPKTGECVRAWQPRCEVEFTAWWCTTGDDSEELPDGHGYWLHGDGWTVHPTHWLPVSEPEATT